MNKQAILPLKDLVNVSEIKSLKRDIPVIVTSVPYYLFSFAIELIAQAMESRIEGRVFSDLSDLETYLEFAKSSAKKKLVLSVKSKFSVRQISDLGYEKVSRVWNPGEFSLYGDVVVLWIKGWQNPVRLSLFGEEIEQISLIDSNDRRSISELDAIEFSNNKISESDSIESLYESFVGGESYSQDLKLELIFVKKLSQVELSHFDMQHQVFDMQIGSLPYLTSTTNLQKSLTGILKDFINRGYKVVHYSSRNKQKHQIIEPLKALIARQIEISELPKGMDFSKGFYSQYGKKLFLTDYEVYGELNLSDSELTGVESDARLAQKADLIKKDGVFKKIAPLDYVVHEDHGVGQYTGIVEREGGLYLELAYAGKDRLFIPINQARKITKYVGGKASPQLTTLNSGVWRRITRKALDDSEKVAKELIQLYAMRQLADSPVEFDDPKLLDSFDKFVRSFLHKDTEDQVVATRELLEDLQSGHPMDRLLVGDVGFGKTEIAMRAIFAVTQAGYQAAMLAPTTILVEQHRVVLEKRLKGAGVKVVSLSRFQSRADFKENLKMIESGQADVVVGTHALLSEDVKFKKLGLIVIDEEQKFGVKQKEKLKAQRVESHVLAMSATPIPRTLNMSLSGIRDISVIASPPPNRRPILNKFAKFDWDAVKEALQKELDRGGQAYYLHNRVTNIEFVRKKIESLFPDKNIGVAHGQLPEGELAKVMKEFAEGKIDVLVCTIIIENGLDLPNANTLIVDDANNLGLSQLYQIRGRVGRSDRQAYAYFLYKSLKGDAGLRLDAIKEAHELGGGFLLANRDLEIRGAGALLGKEQSGAINSVGYGMYINMIGEKIEELKEQLRK